MYIPSHYKLEDRAEILSFMKRFNFATIITADENFPIATHLPFIVSEKGDKIFIYSHFARENNQWKQIERQKILVIFSEPHAYISPKYYEKELNVPTWNYISVHAYGNGKLITTPDKVIELLEDSIDAFEINYREQWNSLPSDYKMKMIEGIVAFEIELDEIQAKKKLSQNKKHAEQGRIVQSLSKSKNTHENLIAEYMQQQMEKKKRQPEP